ncbi:hypothetical protein Dred_2379 [Desulforamulus reducens MI-1]|uniref:Uncharacterized protein n=1 Tax=Desulforamulus reducens (strain ATCC BAA-1160 / DSM 100696 / MI-1) TaxID=349161 RepID=A4J736_DESRM|nr:hypothetical protein [Desulforamulus reducens]ABO50889.1 hypothetical protein Dred_2379 [Desulforamulus reducens MI-1]
MSKVLLIKESSLHPLSLLDRLTGYFVQEDYILSHGFSNLDVLLNRMIALSQQGEHQKIVFTVYPGGDCSFINTMKETCPLLDSLQSNTPEKTLAFLYEYVLGTILGLTAEVQQQNIICSDDLPGALRDVDEGQYALGIIVAS